MDITTSDYQRFCQLLETQSGILLGDNKQYLVESRLTNFIKNNQLDSLSELTTEISKASGRHLLQKVVDQMTTNETLWFRDGYPFEYMRKELIPNFSKQGRFRIWCAACSSGQEPFSIAMLLDQSSASGTEIIASDLSSKILEKANKGVYQDIELKRGLPNDKLKRYFNQVDEISWQIKPSLKSQIRFNSLNLLDLPYRQGQFEIIFCRNVLIYFSQDNKTKVLDGLINSLKPGGYLFLGASESLTRDCKPLEMVRCNPGLVYRKSL
ncbi:MAG: protein-glutamate O-methyltransferase CheR [Enterobacterales bacterium]|nr:protein-glutamate O-methyltransferase CheR [Enterobacterales bacterium]